MSRSFPKEFVFLCGAHMDQTMRLDAQPVQGSSNPAEISVIPGGAALNSASIAAVIGMNCHLASPIGDDAFGVQLREAVAERGIGDGLIECANPTGVYAVIFDPAGDVVIGAAGLSIYASIDKAWIDSALRGYRSVTERTGIFINSNLQDDLLAASIQGFGCVAAATISPGKAPRLQNILNQIDILFTNRKEACALLDVSADANAETLVNQLRDRGVESGTISDGSNSLHWWSDANQGAIVPLKVSQIEDVNGAGDALAGSMLALLSKGQSFEDAVPIAMKVAAETLAHSGPYPSNAKSSLPSIVQDCLT